jgi:hypothetical protein
MVILYHHNSDYANKIDLTPSSIFLRIPSHHQTLAVIAIQEEKI